MLRTKLLSTNKKIRGAIKTDDSVLIIGRGNSSYKLRQIEYYDSKAEVQSLYRNSELCEAFIDAFEIGAKNIYLLNVQNVTDYIEVTDVIKQYNFAYIVPLGVRLSDTFFHVELKKQMTYAEYYLLAFKDCNSLIVFTDNHATDYEDIDEFINDMKKKVEHFKMTAQIPLKQKGRNLCFVANNLANYKHANLPLAVTLAKAKYDEYPQYDFGKAIFDIDSFDIRQSEMMYFKNNELKNTSVENMINFRHEKDADKIILIDKAIRYIERYLDLSQYEGKLYSDYIKLQVYTELSTFLRNIKGIVIRDYKINSIKFIKNDNLTGIIINDFSITPINSIEDFEINMEV